MPSKQISAGGIVYRREAGQLQIQLITDRYGKISFPKGKRENSETIEQTALREIKEETGIIGRIVRLVDIIAYTYHHPQQGDIQKEVHYYLVESEGGILRPQTEEIRSVAWYDPEVAWERQCNAGYDNNDFILEKALKLLDVHV